MQSVRLQLKKLGEIKLGIIILGAGLLIGIIISKVLKGLYWNHIDILDTNYLSKIKDATIDYSVLIRYVFWNNYRTFILFWIFCSTAIGIPYISLSILYAGIKCGFLGSIIMMRYGFKGIFLIFGYTFPHYLIYIPVALLCLRSGYSLCKSMYYENKVSKRGKIERVIKHLLIIVILALALMLGGFLETYAGSFLLKKILALF